MTDNGNLFSGLKILSQQELQSDKEENTEVESNSTEEQEVIVESEGHDDPKLVDDTVYDNGDASLSLASPEEMKAAMAGGSSDQEELADDVQSKVDDAESEQDLDVKAKKYLALAKDLQAEGILSGIDDDFDPSLEGLRDLFSKEKEMTVSNKIANFKKSFSGAKKVFLDIEDGFDSEVEAMEMSKKIDFYSNIDVDAIEGNEALAERILGESLRMSGFSEERIQEEIEDARDLGKLEGKAAKSLPGITAKYNAVVEEGKQKNKQKQAEYNQQQEDNFNSLLNAVDSREYIVEGIPYNKTHKDKLKNKMTTAVYKDQNGTEYTELGNKQRQNPQDFDMLVNYYEQLGLFNMKDGKFSPDISKLKNIAKTKASHDLDKIIDQEEAISRNKNKGQLRKERSSVTDNLIAKLDRGYKK